MNFSYEMKIEPIVAYGNRLGEFAGEFFCITSDYDELDLFLIYLEMDGTKELFENIVKYFFTQSTPSREKIKVFNNMFKTKLNKPQLFFLNPIEENGEIVIIREIIDHAINTSYVEEHIKTYHPDFNYVDDKYFGYFQNHFINRIEELLNYFGDEKKDVDVVKVIMWKINHGIKKRITTNLTDEFSKISAEAEKIKQSIKMKKEKVKKQKYALSTELPIKLKTQPVKQVTATVDNELEKLLNELESMIGLNSVKESIKTMVNVIQFHQMRRNMGLPVPVMSHHMIFKGNPGTGKTTVARLIGKIYKALNILQSGHTIEVNRSSMVGEYLGHSESNSKKLIQEALGGVLFIDEAHALFKKNSTTDFGKDVIDTIIKAMEDQRSEFILVVAGYTEEMEEFIRSNPGFRSRFANEFVFEDYTPQELYDIFIYICKNNKYRLNKEAGVKVLNIFVEQYMNRGKDFSNGRLARNYFERATKNMANRVVKQASINESVDIQTIIPEDIPEFVE